MNLAQIFNLEKLKPSGHDARYEDQNLGLGWLYYALVRMYRPTIAVVIGSWRGFVPIVIAQAMRDNVEGGVVVFIDPSLVDDFWMDAEKVRTYFTAHGAPNVVHYRMTTQEFVQTDVYRSLQDVGLLFVDGLHTAEQAKFDHLAFKHVLSGPALFHDSRSTMLTNLYTPPVQHNVHEYIAELRQHHAVMDFAIGPGLAVVLP